MGNKYEFKPDSNPGAGEYDHETGLRHTLARS